MSIYLYLYIIKEVIVYIYTSILLKRLLSISRDESTFLPRMGPPMCACAPQKMYILDVLAPQARQKIATPLLSLLN